MRIACKDNPQGSTIYGVNTTFFGEPIKPDKGLVGKVL